MRKILKSTPLHRLAAIFIAGVGIFHGLYSKILNGIPRHRMIAGDNLGKGAGGQAVQSFNLMHGLDESTGLGNW